MANSEHIEILKQGVETWNLWRQENRDIPPDLSMADLTNASLVGVNLSKTDLTKANLVGADLAKANLTMANLIDAVLFGAELNKADLTMANLNEANISGAELSEANFTEASLIESNLTYARLMFVNFTQATLIGTDLEGALMEGTIFSQTDLSKAKNLEDAFFFGPCSIGIDTISMSEGKLPESFLRGCGLNDWEIEQVKLYKPNLSNEAITDILYKIYELRSEKAIRFHRCFISYCHNDKNFAQQLYNDLQDTGVRCWFAPEDMKGGRKLNEQIINAIDLHDKLLLILSETSIKSDWVAYEITKARGREKRENRHILFPLRLVEWDSIKEWESFDADSVSDLASEIRSLYIPDFTNWKDPDSYKKAFSKLLQDLRAD